MKESQKQHLEELAKELVNPQRYGRIALREALPFYATEQPDMRVNFGQLEVRQPHDYDGA